MTDNIVTLKNGIKMCPFASFDELIDYALERKKILVAVNAEKIFKATEQTISIINKNIGYCDGMGAVMAVRQYGHKEVVKLPGCELWLKIVSKLVPLGKSFYLVGGRQNVIEETVRKLKTESPAIKIVGFRNGYFETDDDKTQLLADIVEKKPDVVFVAMGSPKQELLMEEMHKRHPAVYQGLGGSFDVYVGAVKRAPKWWVDHNLEFVYRLVKQPSRIKRQIFLVKFYAMLKFGKI